MAFRIEFDSMGEVRIPESAYYGSQTQRARDNFPISGRTFPPALIGALAQIKEHAAAVNRDLGLLDGKVAAALIQAAKEVRERRFDDQFVVDVFQPGSGTSTNMNMNEILASRANEILTGRKGGRSPVHPNDHANLGQSSNDIIPSAIHIAASLSIRNELIPALHILQNALYSKAQAFAGISKIGRTHLQDALPVIADNLLGSISLLTAAARVFAGKCIEGITANADICEANIEKSLALATLLIPHIGYDQAASLAKQAHDSGKTIRETVKEAGILPDDDLNRILKWNRTI